MLLITMGNPLRRDDGVAHALRDYLDCEMRSVVQLTPEIAEEMARFDTVVFADADICATDIVIEPVPEAGSQAISHVATASQVVALSRKLFGFTGRGLLCRIPVSDISFRSGLSRRASALAARAAEQLGKLNENAGFGAR